MIAIFERKDFLEPMGGVDSEYLHFKHRRKPQSDSTQPRLFIFSKFILKLWYGWYRGVSGGSYSVRLGTVERICGSDLILFQELLAICTRFDEYWLIYTFNLVFFLILKIRKTDTERYLLWQQIQLQSARLQCYDTDSKTITYKLQTTLRIWAFTGNTGHLKHWGNRNRHMGGWV
jgi:hypothetical protein